MPDEFKGRTRGGLADQHGSGGPQDHGVAALEEESLGAEQFRCRSVEWSELEDAVAFAFPTDEPAHRTVAQRTFPVIEENGAVGRRLRILHHRNFRQHLRRSFLFLGRAVQVRVFQTTRSLWRRQTGFDA